MAELIKKIIEKNKNARRDAKFKRAGPGHKLNDDKPNTVPMDHGPSSVRSEPSSEAKQAGLAALARFATSTSSVPGFSSFNMSQCKKDLQQIPNDQTSGNESEKSTKGEQDACTLLAVQGVYFKCPLIGPDILTKQEWKVKIKKYLYEELVEERGLAACLIIHSCNKNRDKVEQCIATLTTYLQNILENPNEEKYQRIRLSNRIYQDKVSKIEGSMELLLAAGFETKTLPFKDTTEEYLVFNAEKADLENLQVLIDALQNAEPIGIELDRNVQVLLASQAAVKIQLPSDFYALTADEIKREQQSRIEKLESCMQLRTKAMREKEEQRELKKYRYAVIRIRFPDGIFLQGTFGVHEQFKALQEFVSECLERPGHFVLKDCLGHQFTDSDCESSLLDLRLIPASILIFEWDDVMPPSNYLKSDLLVQLQDM